MAQSWDWTWALIVFGAIVILGLFMLLFVQRSANKKTVSNNTLLDRASRAPIDPVQTEAVSKFLDCSSCGAPVDPAARRCAYCGRVIQIPISAKQRRVPAGSSLSGSLLVLRALIIILVGACIVAMGGSFIVRLTDRGPKVSPVTVEAIPTSQLAVTVPSKGSKAPSWGPVAYYPFDKNAYDESGNRNHAAINLATLTSDRFGNPEHAYYFDGKGDFIEVVDNHDLDLGTGNFAVSGWFKTSQVHNDPDGTCIIDKSPQYGSPWTLRLEADGRLKFHYDNSIYSNKPVNDDLWHHFVVLRSISTIMLVLDGELQGFESSTSSGVNSILLSFGCVHDAERLRGFFSGVIDDVKIYNRALTEEEIQTLYHIGGWGN